MGWQQGHLIYEVSGRLGGLCGSEMMPLPIVSRVFSVAAQ